MKANSSSQNFTMKDDPQDANFDNEKNYPIAVNNFFTL